MTTTMEEVFDHFEKIRNDKMTIIVFQLNNMIY